MLYLFSNAQRHSTDGVKRSTGKGLITVVGSISNSTHSPSFIYIYSSAAAILARFSDGIIAAACQSVDLALSWVVTQS